MAQIDTLTMWVQRDNPQARLELADARCGKRFAVVMESHNPITPYLPLNELGQYLQGIYHVEEYKRKIGRA